MLKKVSDLKDGDVFEWQGQRHVAIEDYVGDNCLWVTIPRYYIYPEQDGTYGYTSACVLSISEDNIVNVPRNLLEEIEVKLKC